MKSIMFATAAALLVTGAAHAASWDPANSSRDRQIQQQLLRHQADAPSEYVPSYDPADDDNGPVGGFGPAIATRDAAPLTEGYIPSIDPFVTDRD